MPTYAGWSAIPKIIGTHVFPPFPTRLDRDAVGTSQAPWNTGANLFGDTLSGTFGGGDSYYRHLWTNPLFDDGVKHWLWFGGYLRDMPPLGRCAKVAGETGTVSVRIGTGNTTEVWRKNDLLQEVSDIITAEFDTVFLEHLYCGLATAPTYWGDDAYKRTLTYAEAVEDLRAAGKNIQFIPMPDVSGGGVSQANLANAIVAMNIYSSAVRVTIGGNTYLVVVAYGAEKQPVSWWQGVRSLVESAGVKIKWWPCFTSWNGVSGGSSAQDWVTAGEAAGLVHWGSRNTDALPPGSADTRIALAAQTESGTYVCPIAHGDSRPKSREFDESKGGEVLSRSWSIARVGAVKAVQACTWNDYSEHSHFCPGRQAGALDPATLDPRFGVRTDLPGSLISTISVWNLRYLRAYRDGVSIPNDDAALLSMRKHRYAAIPTASGYTITAQLTPTGKGTATSAEIGADTRMWQRGVRTQSGGTWSFNPNAGGTTKAVDRVFLRTCFKAETRVVAKVDGAVPVVSGEVFDKLVPAGEQVTEWPLLEGSWTVEFTRDGTTLTHSHPFTVSDTIVSQDFQYTHSLAALTFPPPAAPVTGTLVVNHYDLGGASRMLNAAPTQDDGDLISRGEVRELINSLIPSAVAAAIRENTISERRKFYARNLNADDGLFILRRDDVTANALTMTSGVLVLTRFVAPWDEDYGSVEFYAGGTAGASLTLHGGAFYEILPNGDCSRLVLASTTTATVGSSSEFTVSFDGILNLREDASYAYGHMNVGTTPYSVTGLQSATGGQTDEAPWSSAQLTGQTDFPTLITAAQIAAAGTNTRRVQAKLIRATPDPA